MRRLVTLLVSLAMAFGLFAGTALAGGHEWGDVPPHGHVMLIGVELEVDGDDVFVHFKKCVEFPKLRVPAHHHSIHTGNAGGSPFAPGALFHAGNWVVPLEPFAPFTGCESFSSGMPF